MYKCPNKNLPEWKELERVVPEVAYTVWDLNNGYGIDKAPNGEPSILFQDLLDHFDGDREAAIKTKVNVIKDNDGSYNKNIEVYSQQFDYDNINFFSEKNDTLKSLEPSLIEANSKDIKTLETLAKIALSTKAFNELNAKTTLLDKKLYSSLPIESV